MPPPDQVVELPQASAWQVQHRGGVPQVDASGHRLEQYDPGRSFFPLVLYHAVASDAFGARHDLAEVKAAGYNTVHLWPEQDIDAALASAERNGLRAIIELQNDAQVERFRRSPALLAWMIENEPTQFVSESRIPAHQAANAERRRHIAEIDPGRATLLVDTAGIGPAQRWLWPRWLDSADIVAHFNYPFAKRLDPVRDIGRIAYSVSRAVALTGERKPVWLILQAFADPVHGWYMPEAQELRAMAYAGLIQGASGLLLFAYDSHATRDGQVLGIAPAAPEAYEPAPDYNRDGLKPLRVDAAALEKSRALWHTVATLNREVAALAPSLLRPTDATDCRVEIAEPTRLAAPVRAVLKPAEGDTKLLLLVNMEKRMHETTITCPRGMARLAGRFVSASAGARLDDEGRLRLTLPPFATLALDLQFR